VLAYDIHFRISFKKFFIIYFISELDMRVAVFETRLYDYVII